MLRIRAKLETEKAQAYLNRAIDVDAITEALDQYGSDIVDIYRKGTPIKTGRTRSGWYHRIIRTKSGPQLQIVNARPGNIVDLLLHGSRKRYWWILPRKAKALVFPWPENPDPPEKRGNLPEGMIARSSALHMRIRPNKGMVEANAEAKQRAIGFRNQLRAVIRRTLDSNV